MFQYIMNVKWNNRRDMSITSDFHHTELVPERSSEEWGRAMIVTKLVCISV